MNKIKYILNNFFVIGFLDSLLIPGTLNKLIELDRPIEFKPLVDELICWDLVASPAILPPLVRL